FWYLGMMLPVIGLIQVGEQSMADRYTYLPLLGPAIAIVWLVSDLWKSGPRGNYVLAPVCCGVFAAMLLVTSRQISLWQNTVTLFQHAVDVTSPNDAAEVSLGVGLETQGKTSLAEEHYRAALAINPRDQQALYNFGQLLKKRGDWQGAADEFAAVVAAYPENLAAHLNLAAMLGRLGRDADAIHEFQAVLQADPNSTEALNNLAWLLATSNRPELRDGAEAVRLAERACQLTDYREPAFIGTLAAAYAEAGRLTDAVKTAEKACQQAEAAGNQDLAETNRRLLEIYRAGKPWHEEPVP
ncbi:MAG TPA: tetratricopeptide repeat protein, partial [Candidatus Dormibacteraeota bacterium]|nr:tetratricopeptide repeat protein [Candidatus Dormibacteraeota bacterium]